MKRLALCVAALSAGIVMAAQPAATALVSVDLSKEEVPLDLRSDGAGIIRMQPNSFAIVEW